MYFMYHGEVSISQEDLKEFMLVAKELQIKSLDGDGADKRPNEQQEKTFCVKSIPQTQIENMVNTSETFVKVERSDDTIVLVQEGHITDYFPKHTKNIAKDLESLDMIINSMIQKAEGNSYKCKACGIPKKTKQHLRAHIEGKQVTGFTHPCLKCNDGKGYRSRKSLTGHQFKIPNMFRTHVQNSKSISLRNIHNIAIVKRPIIGYNLDTSCMDIVGREGRGVLANTDMQYNI